MEINNEMLHSSSLLPDSIHVLLSNHVFRVLLILWVLGIVLRGLILILIKLIESDGQGNVDREESADYNDQYKNTIYYLPKGTWYASDDTAYTSDGRSCTIPNNKADTYIRK